MTKAEFMRELAKLPPGTFVMEGPRIRTHCGDCPITAVAKAKFPRSKVVALWDDRFLGPASKRLGLSAATTEAVARAADYRDSPHPEMRRALLKAVGL